MKWYKCHAPNIHDQALVIDEETGDNIAVAYRGEKDGKLLAAAPTMLALLHRLLEDMDLEDTEASQLISEAIAQAEGRAL